jgi:hypothetical protein
MHDLFNAFLQTWHNFCPADYTGFIWDACKQHHSNAVFNDCTASIIAAGIALVGDFLFGSGNWGYSGHTGHSQGHGNYVPSDSATTDTQAPPTNYDSVLADNLPPEFGGNYQLSDVVEAFGGE